MTTLKSLYNIFLFKIIHSSQSCKVLTLDISIDRYEYKRAQYCMQMKTLWRSFPNFSFLLAFQITHLIPLLLFGAELERFSWMQKSRKVDSQWECKYFQVSETHFLISESQQIFVFSLLYCYYSSDRSSLRLGLSTY